MTVTEDIYYESHMNKHMILTQEMHDKQLRDEIADAILKIDYNEIILKNPRQPFDNEKTAKMLLEEAARIAKG